MASQASDIQPPADLASPERIQRGLRSYHQMCAGCHGAPGVEPDWMGQGLNPDPPPLWEPEEREISDAQAARDYWVIEHGIRMTGMPALEPTHSDEEIWDLVAFIQHLPNMSREAYGSAVRDAGLSTETGHEHGTPEGASPSDEGSGDSTHDDHDDHEHGAEAES